MIRWALTFIVIAIVTNTASSHTWTLPVIYSMLAIAFAIIMQKISSAVNYLHTSYFHDQSAKTPRL